MHPQREFFFFLKQGIIKTQFAHLSLVSVQVVELQQRIQINKIIALSPTKRRVVQNVIYLYQFGFSRKALVKLESFFISRRRRLICNDRVPKEISKITLLPDISTLRRYFFIPARKKKRIKISTYKTCKTVRDTRNYTFKTSLTR